MNVNVIGWSDADAVAEVDGVRVRIRRNRNAVRWLCDQHGEDSTHHLCTHTEALGAAPADPDRKNLARPIKPNHPEHRTDWNLT